MTADPTHRALEAELRALVDVSAEPPAVLAATTLQRCRAELAASHGRHEMLHELARLMAALAPPVAVALVWNLALLWLGGELLGRLLPAGLVSAIGAAYVFGAIGWTALVVAAAPALVHGKIARRYREAAS